MDTEIEVEAAKYRKMSNGQLSLEQSTALASAINVKGHLITMSKIFQKVRKEGVQYDDEDVYTIDRKIIT